MNIEEKKLRKFLDDTKLTDQVNNELSINEYFINCESQYSSYLDGAGLNYSMKYICEIKKIIEYGKENVLYLPVKKTYSSDDGFSSDNYSKGDLITSTPIDIENALLKIDNSIKKLYTLIAEKYGITDELIDNYYSEDLEKSKNVVNYLNNLINLYQQIDQKKEMINALNYSINCLKSEIITAKQDIIENRKKGEQKTI